MSRWECQPWWRISSQTCLCGSSRFVRYMACFHPVLGFEGFSEIKKVNRIYCKHVQIDCKSCGIWAYVKEGMKAVSLCRHPEDKQCLSLANQGETFTVFSEIHWKVRYRVSEHPVPLNLSQIWHIAHCAASEEFLELVKSSLLAALEGLFTISWFIICVMPIFLFSLRSLCGTDYIEKPTVFLLCGLF